MSTQGLAAPICYIEIPSPQPEEAAEFYARVFGWTTNPSSLDSMADSKYYMFNTGEGQLMGGFTSFKTVQKGGIIFYIRVDDIDSVLQKVEQAGGLIVSRKEAVGGEYGFTATFKDPSGNEVGLWSDK